MITPLIESRSRPARVKRLRVSTPRSEEHTSELQSQSNLVCRLLLEKIEHERHSADPAEDEARLLHAAEPEAVFQHDIRLAERVRAEPAGILLHCARQQVEDCLRAGW